MRETPPDLPKWMICSTPGCENQRERMGSGKMAYRKTCSSCRKRAAGRPIGGWQKDALNRQEVKLRGVCEACEAKEPFPGMFDVHHRDGDSSHNAIENLAFLCPNCHRVADYELKRGS